MAGTDKKLFSYICGIEYIDFIQEKAWETAAGHYENFMNLYSTKSKIVLFELGIGYNTPAIIRYPFERVTFQNPRATLIRLNAEYPKGPVETAARTIAFTENMDYVIDKLIDREKHEM